MVRTLGMWTKRECDVDHGGVGRRVTAELDAHIEMICESTPRVQCDLSGHAGAIHTLQGGTRCRVEV